MRLIPLLLACVITSPVSLLAQEPPAPAQHLGFAPGDQIQVNLYDFPELATSATQPITVRTDGTIHLPYAGDVKVAGMAPDEAERAIGQALETKGYVHQPNVGVSVVSSTNYVIRVVGEVQKPHSIPAIAPLPLATVLEQTGGLSVFASTHLTVIHPSGEMPTSLEYDVDKPAADVLKTMLAPGDILEVSRAGLFYVIGEVQKPGIYPIGGLYSGGFTALPTANDINIIKHITLLQALTAAGGVTPIAARSHTMLLRTVNGKREAITVDVLKLEKGQIADPLLQPDDIIFVGSSYIRNVTNNLFGNVINALYGVAILKTL